MGVSGNEGGGEGPDSGAPSGAEDERHLPRQPISQQRRPRERGGEPTHPKPGSPARDDKSSRQQSKQPAGGDGAERRVDNGWMGVAVRPLGPGPDFCWTRAKFLETSSSLRPSNFREIFGKSVTTDDRQGTAPPSMSRRPTTSPTPTRPLSTQPTIRSLYRSMRAARTMASARVLICCSPNMSFRRSAFPGNFPNNFWKFQEVGGRRSAIVSGRRSAYLRRRSDFPGNFRNVRVFLDSRGQISSKRMSRNLGQGQVASGER